MPLRLPLIFLSLTFMKICIIFIPPVFPGGCVHVSMEWTPLDAILNFVEINVQNARDTKTEDAIIESCIAVLAELS